MATAEIEDTNEHETYEQTQEAFATSVRTSLGSAQTEISARNGKIEEHDQYIYGDLLERNLDVPIGHDKTPVNWLLRTVEIHKNMFMSRGFQVISTYDNTDDSDAPDEQTKKRIQIENKKKQEYAEARKNLIDSIKRDNGGEAFWAMLAENASAVGDAAVKAYYDEENKKYVLSQIESVENLWAIWSRDDFRKADGYAFVFQVSLSKAVSEYGADEDAPTSPLGSPLATNNSQTNKSLAPNMPANVSSNGKTTSSQPMVTIMEYQGKLEGWGSKNGRLKRVSIGKENEVNVTIVGNKVTKVIDDPKKMPKYYVLPNKRQRRRAWGVSDISEAAININATYVETLSDWRTVAAKVNFPKFKAFGFGFDTQMPKPEKRKVQYLPLAEGQDIVPLAEGDANSVDFKQQMEELKEQFVRETGISRVLFDDPSVTLNSNQALLTSMKPTSDIAEAKKQLWTPIIIQLFEDALETIAQYEPAVRDLIGDDDNYSLKVMWPSLMQKEDPVFQQMLLNRKNAGLISIQSYLEAQGETKEELDRIRSEMQDPITASIHGNQLPVIAQQLIAPPSDKPQVKTNINLRGDLTPGQEANLAHQAGFNDGPFPPSMGPQGLQGLTAQENYDNQGFIQGGKQDGPQPINRGPDGSPIGPGAGGQQGQAQVTTQAQNQEGQGVMSQPGSGATTATPQGALNQTAQNQGA